MHILSRLTRDLEVEDLDLSIAVAACLDEAIDERTQPAFLDEGSGRHDRADIGGGASLYPRIAATRCIPQIDRDGFQFGSAKATMLLPDAAPFLPPPQTITMYCRPFSS